MILYRSTEIRPWEEPVLSIEMNQKNGVFTLLTKNSTYQMRVGPLGYLLHNYYGRRCEDDFGYLHLERDCGASPNPYELADGRSFSLDTMPQEYSGSNCGDYRLPSVLLHSESGISGVDLRFVKAEIQDGKYSLNGLPSAFDRGSDAQTLVVTLRDEATGVETDLLYAVFEQQDVITRAVRFRNTGKKIVHLEKAASACLDLPFGNWDLIHFHGRHAMERQMERISVSNGIQVISSERGSSSHQHNPFVILCEHTANEDVGECYGQMLCYSGNFQIETEKDQTDSVRTVAGIGQRYFSWQLCPGEFFETPELFLSFSCEGFTKLSQNFHRFIRSNVSRSPWTYRRRPVLINSWEAAYFDFDEDRIAQLAEDAKTLGVELLVLDDGWFGERNTDNCSLGDWFIDRKKLPNGLDGLIRRVNEAGLKFGLWIEPEMISEDSVLFREHPDWAIRVPGRKPTIGRCQMVLDLTRKEITEWLYQTFSSLMRENHIEYVKWDMNRCMTDLYSPALPPERQGEVSHRFMMGLYELIERLTSEFPDVLFEGCAGGGGRFDAGMLAYFPQIWCSDNTDPIARLKIQQGSSFGYPISVFGAHVSASPNHQTGRSTPIGTRAAVAMAGTFGYELDPSKLSHEDKEDIIRQVERFHGLEDLNREGILYRLTEPENIRFTAWQTVAEDRKSSLLTLVLTEPEGNPRPLHVRWKGLDPEQNYHVAWIQYYGCRYWDEEKLPERLSGAALMYGGFTVPRLYGDYPSIQILIEQE